MRSHALASQSLEQVLKGNGFKATTGRLALLRALTQSNRPVSAEDLIRQVSGEMDAANVYRALEAFTAKALVHRVDVGHRHMHYELAVLVPHHHHFVCTDCGAQKSIHA